MKLINVSARTANPPRRSIAKTNIMKKEIATLEYNRRKYFLFLQRSGQKKRNSYWIKSFNQVSGEKRKVRISSTEAEQIKDQWAWFEVSHTEYLLSVRKNRRHKREFFEQETK